MKLFIFFKILTSFTAILCCYLFFLLCLSPQSFLFDLGIEGNEAAYFISRRAGMLMLGISVLLFFARNVPHSQARQAIALSISVTMFGLAIAGSASSCRMHLFWRALVSYVRCWRTDGYTVQTGQFNTISYHKCRLSVIGNYWLS